MLLKKTKANQLCDYDQEKKRREKKSSGHLFMIQAIKMIQHHNTFWTLQDAGEKHLWVAQYLLVFLRGGNKIGAGRDLDHLGSNSCGKIEG